MTVYTKFTDDMKYASDNIHIAKRKDGRFQCRICLSYEVDENEHKSNYKYKFIYGVDRNDVLIKRAEFIDAQIHVQNEIHVTNQYTNELLTKKLTDWLYVFNRKQVKANTFDRKESTYIHQILPALKACNLSEIPLKNVTIHHIQAIMDFNFEKGYSYSTLKKTSSLLKEFFAFYDDELEKNPMDKYKLIHKDLVIEKQNILSIEQAAVKEKISQQKQEIATQGFSTIQVSEEEKELAQMRLTTQTSPKDIHFFDDEEILKIKNTIENGYYVHFTSRSGNKVRSSLYKPKQGEFYLFLLNSGIRAGEAVALKYSDVDFEKGTARIEKTAVNVKERNMDGSATGKRNRIFTTPKTAKSYALLYLSPESIRILMQMKAKEPEGYDGFIVHSNHKPIAEKTLWSRLNRLLKGAGVNLSGLHAFRHTCGTKLHEVTLDMKFVAQQLRHTDPGFTARTYVHQTDKRTVDLLHDIKI